MSLRILIGEPEPSPLRHLILPWVLLLTASACSSSSSGGGCSVTLGNSGPNPLAYTTTPAGAAKITGTFSAYGDGEGQYTLSTSVPAGSPLSSCLVSVDGGTLGTSVQVDASTSATHSLTIEIAVGAGYQGNAVCDFSALLNKNTGYETAIEVAQGAGDAG